MNEDAPPESPWKPAGGVIGRPRFDPSLYDPTFVPPAHAVATVEGNRPLSVVPVTTDGAPEAQNGMASTSLVLGLCSALVPVLGVPGVILGVVALGRTKRLPSLPGRERALAGIITSLLLGTVSLAVLVVIAAGGG